MLKIVTRINKVVIFCFDSFFVKSQNDKTHAYLDLEGPKQYQVLKEGEYIEITINCETPPKSITAKIAVVNPMYL